MASSRDGRSWVAETPPTPMGLFGAASTQTGALLLGGAEAILSGGCARPLDDPLAERWLIPAVAAVDGLGGTAWRSEVAFANPGDAAVRVDAYLLPRADSPAPLRARSIELGPGETRVLSDVVGGTFTADGDAGALLVAAQAPIAVTSETATRADGGRAGQAIPAIPEDDLIAAGDRGWLVPVRADGFRTNVGLANATGLGATVLLELRDALGRPVSSRSIALGPWQSQQIGPLDASPTAGLGSASVEVLAGGPVAAYASVVDNATGDPTLVRSTRPVDGPLTVPAAAHLAGDLGTYWRSELGVLAPPGEEELIGVELVTRAAQGADVIPLGALAVADGATVIAGDVVGASGRETAGWLRLQPQGGSVVASSRTFTMLGAGSVGQGVPLISEGDWFGSGETAVLTPLPLVLRGARRSPHEPRHRQLRRGAERDRGGPARRARTSDRIPPSRAGRARVTAAQPGPGRGARGRRSRLGDRRLASGTPGARFAAYASIVDEITGDPVLILAVPAS